MVIEGYEQETQAYEESGNIPEVADPEQEMTEDYIPEEQTEEVDTEEQQEEPQTQETPEQSKEERAHFAQMRRQQEMEQLRQQAYEQAQRDIEDKQYAVWAREQGIDGINSKQDYEIWEQSQKANVPYELMQEIAGMKQMMQKTMQEKQRLEYESTIKAQEQALMSDGDYGDLFKSHEQDIRNIAYSAEVDLNTALAVFLMQDQGRAYFRQLKEQTKKEAQAETVRNITSNQSTPGALSTERAEAKTSVNDMSTADFNVLIEKIKRGEIKHL